MEQKITKIQEQIQLEYHNPQFYISFLQETLRASHEEDLDLHAPRLRSANDSLVYLETKHLPIDIMTEKTYLYYKETLKKQEEN